MKEVEIVAKTKGQPDVKGKAPQYESLAEAAKVLGGEAKALEILNRQVKTDCLNKLRKPATGAMSLAKMISTAQQTGKLSPDAKAKIDEILKKAGISLA